MVWYLRGNVVWMLLSDGEFKTGSDGSYLCSVIVFAVLQDAVFKFDFPEDLFCFFTAQAHAGTVSHPVCHVTLGWVQLLGQSRSWDVAPSDIQGCLKSVFFFYECKFSLQAVGEHLAENIPFENHGAHLQLQPE